MDRGSPCPYIVGFESAVARFARTMLETNMAANVRSKIRATVGLAIACASLIAAPFSHAQTDYPIRPVTVVVAFAPGGMTDIVSRALA